MDTTRLKRFAQETRRKLLEQVEAKLDYVLTSDTPELREKVSLVTIIKEEVNKAGKSQLIDKVAYTWFNRIVALRYMDCNDYQPLGIRIVSPLPNQVSPQILQEAIGGHIPDEVIVDKKKVFGFLDGSIKSKNAENDAFRLLLIAACNHLNRIFPFLFERIDDFSDLLLPDDLTSDFSILNNIIKGITFEDCSNVEIIGWLYQFYISEKKEILINAKKKYKADEIAPVTQLFTPKWIVQYMVDNTLGQFWNEARPDTKITEQLEFYIKPANPGLPIKRDIKSPEEITFFDPCVGSGHILCYAFDVLYKIYEAEGYNSVDIPKLIITNNIYGIDIDDRASQLAGFALMMKGREYDRRFFKKDISPNITSFQNFNSSAKFNNAKVLGSLIEISIDEVDKISIDETSLFAESQKQLKKQADFLACRYDIIVTNPPYINSAYMEESLKRFVETEYSTAKSDLFASFLLRVTKLAKKDGLIGFVCPYVWMFIQSYSDLRSFILKNTTIATLVQLEYNAFGPAVVPICTFTLRNRNINGYMGSYISLSEFTGSENQAPRTLEAIGNRNCGFYFLCDQNQFKKIAGNPIAYNLSPRLQLLFDKHDNLGAYLSPKEGVTTGNNDRFLRLWPEVSFSEIIFPEQDRGKWLPYLKGGAFKRWYGNYDYVINWENDGKELKDSEGSFPRNLKFFKQPGLTWSALSSSSFAGRIAPSGFGFDSKGPLGIVDPKHANNVLAILNSKLFGRFIKVLAPTLDFRFQQILTIPFLELKDSNTSVPLILAIAKQDWDAKEFSRDFKKNELLRLKSKDLEETFDSYIQYWRIKFNALVDLEKELNKNFINAYDLEDDLTAEVRLEEITILKEETSLKNGVLEFSSEEIFSQFMSYSVGCMFGRYSLDRDGLILANKGESPVEYYRKIGKLKEEVAFTPDDDNIIPILEDEWFEDDIVNKFHQFLKTGFGEKDFRKNLDFLEERLGMSVRKYFTKGFYADHIQRYKKRPIYWMFSSPKGHFNVLIYVHRYTPDTVSNILNSYLREFIEKLKTRKEQLKHIEATGSASEKAKAIKEMDKIESMLADCYDYERNILYPLATERIEIDLNNGVLVNYNCFDKAVKEVKGLNDSKTKDQVKKFDWIDSKIIP